MSTKLVLSFERTKYHKKEARRIFVVKIYYKFAGRTWINNYE